MDTVYTKLRKNLTFKTPVALENFGLETQSSFVNFIVLKWDLPRYSTKCFIYNNIPHYTCEQYNWVTITFTNQMLQKLNYQTAGKLTKLRIPVTLHT